MMLVTLTPYDANWPELFAAEYARISSALGPIAVSIDHIGSTSVVGLAAKPVIDVQVQVRDLAEFDKAPGVGLMEQAGFQYHSEYEHLVPFRRLFIRRDGDPPDVNIHLVEAGHPWARRHLLFRDYLRTSVGARERYELMKRDMASREWESVNDYAMAKTEVVIMLEEEAMEQLAMSEAERNELRSSRI